MAWVRDKFSAGPRNQVTAYGLACGVQQRWSGRHDHPTYLRDVTLTLWKEHGAYHVRAHDFAEDGRIFWDVFPTLTAARKRWSAAKKELRQRYEHRKTP